MFRYLFPIFCVLVVYTLLQPTLQSLANLALVLP